MTQVATVIFAAGRGTRLRPLTEQLPKPLVPVLDVPLVDLALQRCAGVGVETFVNVSHHAPRLVRHLDGRGVSILDEGDEPYGTGGTLAALLDRLPDTVVTFNCDVFTDISVSDLLERHRSASTPATFAVKAVETGADLVIEGRPRFVDRRTENVAGYRFVGVACFERRFLEATLPRGRPAGLGETAIRRAVEDGVATLYEHTGTALDVGTLPSLLEASMLALEMPHLVSAPGARSRDAYVGRGASASEGSLGQGAVLLEGSKTEPGARVVRSIVWMNETVPEGASLSDTIWFRNGAAI